MAQGSPAHSEAGGSNDPWNLRVESGWRPEAPPGHQGAEEEQSPKGICLPQHPEGLRVEGA